MVARIAIDGTASGRLFDYSVPENLKAGCQVGSRVHVQFGKRPATGYVIDLIAESDYLPKSAHAPTKSKNDPQDELFPRLASEEQKPRLKPVDRIEGDSPVILPPLVKLAQWMSKYYLAPIERCVQTLLPAPVRTGRSKEMTRLYVEAVEAETKTGDGAKETDEKLTARQAELLADLKRVGGGWLQQVIAEFKCTSDTLRKLEKRGLVTIEERQKRRDPFANRRVIKSSPLPLNTEQAAALKTITDAIEASANTALPSPKPVLLFGVTGSGKTEVYLQAIAAVLEKGKGAIVLVPEIALTPQTVQRFASRFGDKIAVLHSALSDGERFDEWKRIRSGEARVVVGPRSAVFAPVENLGLLVVDEEHEPSYKQDESPRYNARDAAVMRAYLEHCAIVLGSATPALESWRNVQIGKYQVSRLSRRASEDAVMPLVHIVDMRREIAESGQVRLFSKDLMDAIKDRLGKGEQTLLFLNRRGYSTSLVCPTCGYVATCPACDVAYTYHRHDDCLRCHICGAWQRVTDKCPECGDPKFKYTGFGTQRIEQIISACFPHARVARMDADSTSRKMSHDDILGAFKAGKTDILIGTQMIAKGLHFPNVTLVGIVMADSSLHIPDFRAGERTFQLLAQVSGRTGRGAIAGEVFVQTYTPDHPAVQMARTENFEGFAETELAEREALNYPPFSHLTCLTLSGPDETAAEGLLNRVAAVLHAKCDSSAIISDVCPASLAKANNMYRYQLILRSPTITRILPALSAALTANPVPNAMRLSVDIDAMSIC